MLFKRKYKNQGFGRSPPTKVLEKEIEFKKFLEVYRLLS